MYVYNDYWESFKAVLLYPTDENSKMPVFSPFQDKNHECGIGKINVLEGTNLNKNIGTEILGWFI